MKYIKKYILLLLYYVKKVLTLLRDKCLPENENSKPIYLSSFKLYQKEELEKCYDHFKKYFKSSLFLETNELRKYAIQRASEYDKDDRGFYLEFGVWKGRTINYLSRFVKEIYGFDSFKGLREDWVGVENKPKGKFDLGEKIPSLNKNVLPVKGWIQDTLEIFLQEKKPEIKFIHIDVDTYETTKFILEKTKPYMAKNTIILFDELYNFPGWDVGEYKALTEVFSEDQYKFLAFSMKGQQAAVEIMSN